LNFSPYQIMFPKNFQSDPSEEEDVFRKGKLLLIEPFWFCATRNQKIVVDSQNVPSVQHKNNVFTQQVKTICTAWSPTWMVMMVRS